MTDRLKLADLLAELLALAGIGDRVVDHLTRRAHAIRGLRDPGPFERRFQQIPAAMQRAKQGGFRHAHFVEIDS